MPKVLTMLSLLFIMSCPLLLASTDSEVLSSPEDGLQVQRQRAVPLNQEAMLVSTDRVEPYFYSNPLGISGIGDPFVLQAPDGRYYLYPTSGFRVWSSEDLVHWTLEGTVKYGSPWGVERFWAPEVVFYQGRYYMYYTAASSGADDSLRIGVAVSDSPTGPFKDPYDRPLFDYGYAAIDAHVFIDDDGRKYLYYSRDCSGNIVNGRHESHIYVVELGEDMISVKGEPRLLLKPEQPWELASGPGWRWNEGPAVLKRNGVYYLLYSANFYADRRYSVGYATASSPLGPFIKYEQNPILSADPWPLPSQADDTVSGPGHASVAPSPDGSELFIIYHTHTDPRRGGGDRQVCIDRLGFREDGSLYVNGPTLTPQLLPAGASDLRNIAPKARLEEGWTMDGYSAQALVDGEIGIYPRGGGREWISDSQGAWVQLSWDAPRRLRFVCLYGGALKERQPRSGTLFFSDGTVVRDVSFPRQPGAAAIVRCPDTKIEWVRFVVDELPADGGPVALSEIMVLGYPSGHVWLTSPEEGQVLTGKTNVEIEAPEGLLRSIHLKLDGVVIYEGTMVPQEIVLDPVRLAAGTHVLSLSATLCGGRVEHRRREFRVQHVRLELPEEGEGEKPGTQVLRLRGKVDVQTHLMIPPDRLQAAVLELRPVVNGGEDAVAYVVYAGESLSRLTQVKTTEVPDGAYDLTVRIVTSEGIVSEVCERVVVDNWEVLEDPIEPPVESTWFGALEQLKAVGRSDGWEYTGDDPAAFLGDADRLRRTGNTDEFLVWELAGLTTFQFQVFARNEDLLKQVVISVGDGATWVDVPYAITDKVRSQDGWYRFTIAGALAPGQDAKLVRLFCGRSDASADAKSGEFQVGHVILKARKEQQTR